MLGLAGTVPRTLSVRLKPLVPSTNVGSSAQKMISEAKSKQRRIEHVICDGKNFDRESPPLR
jgi:hypothetical protein